MNFTKQQPIYMQIADFVLENILATKYQQGERLQSVREMAATTQVNPNTVQRTFSYLQEEGIIYNQRGIGYFVAKDALEKTRKMKKQEFVEQYLPEVFKIMDLLGINFEELQKIYQAQKAVGNSQETV